MTKTTAMIGRLVAALVAALAVTAAASAETAPPEIPKEVRVIGADDLKRMLDRREAFLLVDSRNEREYRDGHIIRAINVYDKDMEARRSKFPADRNHPIVFYCNGYPKCVRSLAGAKMARAWGYTRVALYVAGFPDWEARGYPIERE